VPLNADWEFGQRPHAYTQFGRSGGDIGWDLPTEENTPFRSVVPGTVVYEGQQPNGWGGFVQIRGDDGNIYNYAHLNRENVSVGQRIDDPNFVVGLTGNTGYSTGAHLDFTVFGPDTPRTNSGYYYDVNDRVHGGAIDPENLIGQPWSVPAPPAQRPKQVAANMPSQIPQNPPSWLPQAAHQHMNAVYAASEATGVPSEIIMSLATRENGAWNAGLRVPQDGMGLLQVLPSEFADETGQEWARARPSQAQLADPAFNLRYGANYLADQYRRYGNWADAISAYNAGRPIPGNRANYVNQILGRVDPRILQQGLSR
jgi:hypothetical protein